jgi:hypothetical protein
MTKISSSRAEDTRNCVQIWGVIIGLLDILLSNATSLLLLL